MSFSRDFILRLVAVFLVVALTVSGYSFLSDSLAAPILLPEGLLAGFVSVATVSIILDRSLAVALGSLAIAIIMALIGIVPTSIASAYLILGAILAILASLLRRKWRSESKIAIVWLALILAIWAFFVSVTWQSAMAFAATEPTGSGWGYDPYVSLKMFYLMKRGLNFYQAYVASLVLNWGLNSPQIYQGTSFFSWRGPLLFYLWMLLPDSSTLYGAYVVLCSMGIISGYSAFSKISKAAGLIAATVLMPYFTLGLSGTSGMWIEWEFWGAIFSIFSFAAFFMGHRKAAVLPAFLAAACKDTLAGALAGGLLACAVKRNKREALVWLAGLGFYVIYTVSNYFVLRQYLGVTTNASYWLGNGGPAFVVETFHFGTPWLWEGWAWILIAISAVGIVIIRPLHLSVFAAMTALSPIAAFLAIGNENDTYWGVVYVPFVLLMLAYVIGVSVSPRRAIGPSTEALDVRLRRGSYCETIAMRGKSRALIPLGITYHMSTT